MVEVSLFNPLLKQGRLLLIPQDHDQKATEYFQGLRLHNLSGQPVPALSKLQCLPDVQRETPAFQHISMVSCHAPVIKSPPPSHIIHFLQVFVDIDVITPEPSQLFPLE